MKNTPNLKWAITAEINSDVLDVRLKVKFPHAHTDPARRCRSL